MVEVDAAGAAVVVAGSKMRLSPQKHYERSRNVAVSALMLLVLVAEIAVVLFAWQHLLALPRGTQIILGVVGLLLLIWPTFFMGMIVCELVREWTCAACPKCGGPAYYDPPEDGDWSETLVTYTCRRCKFRAELASRYCDEAPRRNPSDHFGGCGGGGG